MKRILSLICVSILIVCCLSMVGCKDSITGTYSLVGVKYRANGDWLEYQVVDGIEGFEAFCDELNEVDQTIEFENTGNLEDYTSPLTRKLLDITGGGCPNDEIFQLEIRNDGTARTEIFYLADDYSYPWVYDYGCIKIISDDRVYTFIDNAVGEYSFDDTEGEGIHIRIDGFYFFLEKTN